MQPVSADRQLQTRGVQRSGSFGISQKNASWIKGILRDKIYKDKKLAVLREYAANAWDANRMPGGAGADVPIKVVLPTDLEPFLLIRDFGPGLSEDEVFTVYTQYGESTKRTTNNAVGMLGIGSKSAFAYSDQFTITSWHNGTKAIYNAALTNDDDSMVKLGEWPSDEPTGIEIKVPVKVGDIPEFEQKARGLFPYFDPPPDINTDLPKRDENARNNGYVEDRNIDLTGDKSNYYANRGGRWIAIMGCIPYTVDIGQIREGLEEEDLWNVLNRINGGLYFDIGAVEIAASREELEYTDFTKAALVAKFRVLIDEYVEEAVAVLKDPKLVPWTKRLRAKFMKHNLGLPLPARWTRWGTERVIFSEKQKVAKVNADGTPAKDANGADLFDEKLVTPEKFSLRNRTYEGIKPTAQMAVDRNTVVYIKDDHRHLSGFRCIENNAVVVAPHKGVTDADARKEFDEWCEKLNITGVPVKLLSGEQWVANSSGRTPNKKHSKRVFKLKDGFIRSGGDKLSDNWEIVDRESTDDDVFVIVSAFKRHGKDSSFYKEISDDRELAKSLGITYPDIFGYKTTAKKKVKVEDCDGTEWLEWRKGFWRTAITSTHLRLMSQMHWSRIIQTEWSLADVKDYWKDDPKDTGPALLAAVEGTLGKGHEITKLVAKHLEGRAAVERGRLKHLNSHRHHRGVSSKERKEAQRLDQKWAGVENLMARLGHSRRKPAAHLALERVMDKYPLLREMGNLSNFNSKRGKLWLEYVQMMDRCGNK